MHSELWVSLTLHQHGAWCVARQWVESVAHAAAGLPWPTHMCPVWLPLHTHTPCCLRVLHCHLDSFTWIACASRSLGASGPVCQRRP